MLWVGLGTLLLALLGAAAWGEREVFIGDAEHRWPQVTITLGLTSLAGIAASYGLWIALGPVASGWIREGVIWGLLGCITLFLALSPMIPAGLALFYLGVLPFARLFVTRQRERLQAMRAAATAAVAEDRSIQQIWWMNFHGIKASPPHREEWLIVVATQPIAVELERLRATIDELRDGHRRPLVVRVLAPDAAERMHITGSYGHPLFEREPGPPKNVA